MTRLGTTRGHTSWGLGTQPADHWTDHALCAQDGHDPEDWHAIRALTHNNLQALATCQRCPVLDQCHTYYQRLPPHQRTRTIAGGVYYDSDGKPAKTRYGRPLHLAITNPPNNPPPTSDDLTTGQAAIHTGLSPNTIATHCQRGTLPGYRNEDGHWRITRDDLDTWARSRKPISKPHPPTTTPTGDTAQAMTTPVQCAWCHHAYDLAAVPRRHVAPGTLGWTTPCCGLAVDDTCDHDWTPVPAYRRLAGARP